MVDNIGLDNIYIDQTLKNFSQFYGVFAADHLNKYFFRPSFYSMQYIIVNTEPISSKKHGHWIALCRYLDKDEKVILECFDSLAWPISLLHSNIKNTILNANFDLFVTNNKMLQHPGSSYCGFYTIARFLGLIRKSNITDFLSHFTCDLIENDLRVLEYIRAITK